MKKPLIIIGWGGHASVLVNIIQIKKMEILGFTDCNSEIQNHDKFLGTEDVILKYHPNEVMLVNGIGTIGRDRKREEIFRLFKQSGYQFASIIHPTSIIASNVVLEEGVQIMAGVIIQPGAIIGSNSIINTKVSVDHGCHIGSHVHLAPGVTLSGNVTIEQQCHIGTGASIIQGVMIKENALVGAGAVVIRDVKKGSRVVGIPAKEVKKKGKYS